jgi:peptide/nickel transport system ATP-binding protein
LPQPILEVDDLRTYYFTREGTTSAVDGVSFRVHQGEIVGIAGESGCGKSTVAHSVLRLLPSSGRIVAGNVDFEGTNLVTATESELRRIRWRKISIVFQAAMNALNPVRPVGEQISEAIVYHHGVKKAVARSQTRRLLEMVGLDPSRMSDYPHEFSGGMRQRIVIAMAIACEPDLVIADEPATALDVLVQAQILDLLKKLKHELGLSMILITHDLSVLREMSDRVAIMYAGKLVEYASVDTIMKRSQHPYTKALLQALPQITEGRHSLKSLPGSPPNLVNPPSGCRFHPRCPSAMDKCRSKEPPLMERGTGHLSACFLS